MTTLQPTCTTELRAFLIGRSEYDANNPELALPSRAYAPLFERIPSQIDIPSFTGLPKDKEGMVRLVVDRAQVPLTAGQIQTEIKRLGFGILSVSYISVLLLRWKIPHDQRNGRTVPYRYCKMAALLCALLLFTIQLPAQLASPRAATVQSNAPMSKPKLFTLALPRSFAVPAPYQGESLPIAWENQPSAIQNIVYWHGTNTDDAMTVLPATNSFRLVGLTNGPPWTIRVQAVGDALVGGDFATLVFWNRTRVEDYMQTSPAASGPFLDSSTVPFNVETNMVGNRFTRIRSRWVRY